MTDAEAQAAARARTQALKKIAIGTAVVAGVAIGGMAISKYGREYADEIIRSGATLQTVHADPKIIETGKFYSAKRFTDKIKYKGLFGRTSDGSNGGTKYRITATVTRGGMKIAGNKNAEKIYEKMLATNGDFRDAVRINGHTPNYRKFNTYGLLGDGSYLGASNGQKAQKMFIDELKSRGYSGVADINDRRYSGYKTHANIYFDTKKLTQVKVHDMSYDEVKKAEIAAYAISLVEGMTNPVTIGVGSAVVGTKLAFNSIDKQEYELKEI